MVQRTTTLQFSTEQFEEMEKWVKSGYYSSKAELVREAVREKLFKLKENEFYKTVLELREKSKVRGARITSPFLSKDEKRRALREVLKKKIIILKEVSQK